MPPLYERPLVMRTSMPSSSSSLATRSTFSSLALVKTFLIACSPLSRHVRGRLAGGDADQSFLRRAGDQPAVAVVDQPARQPDRERVVKGKRGSVRVELGGRRRIKNKNKQKLI